MSRSSWAWAETRWRCASVHGVGKRRFEGRLILERRFLPGAVSATKYAVIFMAAGVLLMAAEAAPALAASRAENPPSPAHPVVLRVGSGYAGGPAVVEVRSLQRHLDGGGYAPGPVDGLFGPRTEHAVERFQSAHGLRVDGIAGPVTLAALRTPSSILNLGAGYVGGGAREVRGLQRELRRDGFGPGPIDGRYGPLTERAVRRFQAAHGLSVDGVAGPHTLGELKRVAAGRQTASRSTPRPTAPTRQRCTLHLKPSHPAAPQHARPATTARGQRAGRRGGASWPVVLVVVGLVCLVALIWGVWLIERRRRPSRIAAVPPSGADTAVLAATELGGDSDGHEHMRQRSSPTAVPTSRAMQEPRPTSACYSSVEATSLALRRHTAGLMRGAVPKVRSTWLDCSSSVAT